MEAKEKDDRNNRALIALIKAAGLTQDEARILVNKGQVRETALSTWKAYLGGVDSKRWRQCPDRILALAQKRLSKLSEPQNSR